MSRFDWDPVKAEANLRAHGVTFEEAAEMLEGDLCDERPDARHSLGEVRVRTIGYAPSGGGHRRDNLDGRPQAADHLRTARHEARTR